MRVVIRLGAVLIVGGMLAVVGYTLYEFGRELFKASVVPAPVLVGITAIVLGILVLLGAVAVERLRRRKRENFEEVEY